MRPVKPSTFISQKPSNCQKNIRSKLKVHVRLNPSEIYFSIIGALRDICESCHDCELIDKIAIHGAMKHDHCAIFKILNFINRKFWSGTVVFSTALADDNGKPQKLTNWNGNRFGTLRKSMLHISMPTLKNRPWTVSMVTRFCLLKILFISLFPSRRLKFFSGRQHASQKANLEAGGLWIFWHQSGPGGDFVLRVEVARWTLLVSS